MQISSCFHISATFSTAKRLNGVLFRTLLFASSGHCNETSAVLATTVQEFEPPLHATHRFSRDFQCSKACASAVCVVQSKLEILTPFWLMSQRLIATLSMSGESQNVLGKLILSKYVAETRSISWVCYVFAQEQFVQYVLTAMYTWRCAYINFYHQCFELNCFISASVYRGTTMGCSLITRPYRLLGVPGGVQMGCLSPICPHI